MSRPKDAAATHDCPAFCRYYGPEFIGRAFAQWADTHDVRLHFITPGKPVQNAYIESFHGRFRDECLNGAWFLSLADARRVIEAWRQDYNTVRPHSALGYITPAEFEQLSPNGEWGTQPAEQKEARCSTPPPHASLGAPEAP